MCMCIPLNCCRPLDIWSSGALAFRQGKLPSRTTKLFSLSRRGVLRAGWKTTKVDDDVYRGHASALLFLGIHSKRD